MTSAASAATAPAPAASSAPAPAGCRHAHRHGHIHAALRALNLSAEQKQQLRTTLQTARAQRASGQPLSRTDLRKQIDGILTSAQRTQF
ncbi:MAG TPA: hypothetical protein VKG44_11535, partial [Candidatus Baltobacteraceae bacterium]|nr:hypothetical protein [Candidatus Baltobacteraceae bacterium]